MPTRSSIELYIPANDRKPGGRGRTVPFLTTPYDPWCWDNEGYVVWTINGVALLGRDLFTLYPGNQLQAVLEILELALARTSGEVNVGGSILYLLTRPAGSRETAFGIDVYGGRHAQAAKTWDREVVGNAPEVARKVIDTVRTWTAHVPQVPPPQPHSNPLPPTLASEAWSMLKRVEMLEHALPKGQ